LIDRSIGRGGNPKIHPATRVFQALRRAVNEEGDELLEGLSAADRWSAAGGRLVVISFHSLEDAVVKRWIAAGEERGAWKPLSKKPLAAERDEVRANPRSRSAKLRSAERVRELGSVDEHPEALP
jgi:16S rRNA (cytosine1402-N4)-methyltransferase